MKKVRKITDELLALIDEYAYYGSSIDEISKLLRIDEQQIEKYKDRIEYQYAKLNADLRKAQIVIATDDTNPKQFEALKLLGKFKLNQNENKPDAANIDNFFTGYSIELISKDDVLSSKDDVL